MFSFGLDTGLCGQVCVVLGVGNTNSDFFEFNLDLFKKLSFCENIELDVETGELDTLLITK
jgi:hypothetical protein